MSATDEAVGDATGRPAAAETVESAVTTRHSVRAFLSTPIPRADVDRLLTLAARSASNSNVQPWHVHVVTGEGEWREPFRSRRAGFGAELYEQALELERSDHAERAAHHRRNYDFFGAPVGLVLTVSEHPRSSALVDAGLFLQTLMLLARAAGLDTCPQASFVDFDAVLREQLDIPADQIVICGVALGVADVRDPLNSVRTDREPLHAFVTHHGDGQV